MELWKNKKFVFPICFSLFLLTEIGNAVAADLYALGAKVAILEEPRFGAVKVTEVKRGDLLSGSEEQNGWIHVTFSEKSGWVSRILVGRKPPSATVSVLNDNNQDDLEGSARRRASSFTTAAAARGLSEDRARINQKYHLDYSGLAWIERQEVEEEEALKFIENKE